MYILTKLRTFASNIVQFSEKMSHIFKQFCAPLKRRPLQCGVSSAYCYATA